MGRENGGHDVGYIRVSSYDQSTERQLGGIDLNRTFTEKASAKDAQRPKLKDCLEYIRCGDTLHVHSIDRLARNLKDLQSVVEMITKMNAKVVFHKEGLTFTGEDNPTSKLMLQLIGAVAEFERALIKERQREGIASAQKKGVRFGAQRKLSDEQIKEIQQRLDQGEQKKALANEYGISRQTLYTALKR